MLYDPKYWGNTAGNVAATQLSVVAALGTKNNIISCGYFTSLPPPKHVTYSMSGITGVSFDKVRTFYVKFTILRDLRTEL